MSKEVKKVNKIVIPQEMQDIVVTSMPTTNDLDEGTYEFTLTGIKFIMSKSENPKPLAVISSEEFEDMFLFIGQQHNVLGGLQRQIDVIGKNNLAAFYNLMAEHFGEKFEFTIKLSKMLNQSTGEPYKNIYF